MNHFKSLRSKTSWLIIWSILTGALAMDVNAYAEEFAYEPVIVEADTEPAVDEDGSSYMVFEDGMAKPIIDMEDKNKIKAGYTNTNSDILRFAVYVETDYDTDLDGMNDLVQAVVQVPRRAAGTNAAPAIFEASPYMAGTKDILSDDEKDQLIPQPAEEKDLDGFTEDDLYKAGNDHTPVCPAISSLELASRDNEEAFSSNNWYYHYDNVKDSNTYFIDALNNHDYFLVRGFAVVESAGLGTNGSDGLSSCGSIAEVEAFKDVVEWINHKDGRMAFADREGTIPVTADWASGKVAMRGCSYNGTMAYEVAATGVDGLMTIVPEAGIASWYSYTNTQGVAQYEENKYTGGISGDNSSRFFGRDTKSDSIRSLASKLFGYFDLSETTLAGHFGDFWTKREYSDVAAGTIKASALIVQGFNDYNVRTKQADLMRRAFEKSGCDVRVILHQGGHETLETIEIDNNYYEEILNKWYCRYLCDLNNDIENTLPKYYVQSNKDGRFAAYDEWVDDSWCDDTSRSITLSPGNDDQITIETPEKNTTYESGATGSADNKPYDPGKDILMSGDDPYYSIDDYFEGIECDQNGVGEDGQIYSSNWIRRVSEEITIQGKAEVRIRAGVPEIPKTGKGRMVLGAMLYDISPDKFPAYVSKESDSPSKSSLISYYIDRGGKLDPFDLEEYTTTYVDKKLITKGVIDLGSPEAGYYPASAVKGDITAGSYYDYTIHMLPTVYTVQPGHYLWLYLIPEMDSISSNVNVNIDNAYSEMKIPVSSIPEGFNSVTTENGESDDGRIISEKIDGNEVSRRIIDDSRIIKISSNIRLVGFEPDYYYWGSPVIQNDLKLYDGTDLMTEGEDYKISYSNNNKPTDISGKKAVLTITFRGEYSETPKYQKEFNISKALLSDDPKETCVNVSDTGAAYTGSAIKPVPEIRYAGDGGKEIAKNSFKFSYQKDGSEEITDSISEAGQYTIIIEPSGDRSYFTGKMTTGLTVTDSTNKLLKNAKVVFNPASYVYTGKPIVPEPGKYTLSLKLDGRTPTSLTENTDYKVSLVSNNTDPGKATVTFTAIPGNENGITGSVKATFKITKGRELQEPDKGDFTYNWQNYVPYSKSGAIPSWIEVKDGDKDLVKGRDYTVSFSNNKKISQDKDPAKLTIKGKGLYKGSVTLDYYVVTASINRMTVDIADKLMPKDPPDKGYENPNITITDEKGKKLKNNTDYVIGTYEIVKEGSEDNRSMQIRATIFGKGNYFGYVQAKYMYYDKAHDLSNIPLWQQISDKTYTGSDITLGNSELNELLVDGRTEDNPGFFLGVDEDFYVESYKNNRKSGTATVVLRGTGKYGGKRSLKFKIKRQGVKTILQ
ncbi:MAG: hypothetical protein J5910_00910 [Lachnospiraceae bacterium]|nr:hypothetical protein [Lachnospiraceae bacterium]